MKTLILILLIVASFSTSADSIWKDERTYLWTASTVALLADWGTTLDIENHPDRYETNPYMGEHPSRFEVNRYFLSVTAIHIIGNILIEYIPNKNLRTFGRYAENFSVVMTHGKAAIDNFQLGLSVNF